VRTSNADIQIEKSFLAANGDNADKAPFLNLSTVQPATRLSSSLCARRRHSHNDKNEFQLANLIKFGTRHRQQI
jgi:hypothetical protein